MNLAQIRLHFEEPNDAIKISYVKFIMTHLEEMQNFIKLTINSLNNIPQQLEAFKAKLKEFLESPDVQKNEPFDFA